MHQIPTNTHTHIGTIRKIINTPNNEPANLQLSIALFATRRPFTMRLFSNLLDAVRKHDSALQYGV